MGIDIGASADDMFDKMKAIQNLALYHKFFVRVWLIVPTRQIDCGNLQASLFQFSDIGDKSLFFLVAEQFRLDVLDELR